MADIIFTRIAAEATAFGHTLDVRKVDDGPKAWRWRLSRAKALLVREGFSTTESAARSAGKRALLALPAVADLVRRSNEVHVCIVGKERACGAEVGGWTTILDEENITCPACRRLAAIELQPLAESMRRVRERAANDGDDAIELRSQGGVFTRQSRLGR